MKKFRPLKLRFWTQGQIKPHLSRYWLNHEVEDESQFREDVRAVCKIYHLREDVRAVCKIYHQAQELHAQGIHLISVDEKTGIQALERIHPSRVR